MTISPNFSLYRIVVLPAASNPTAKERGRGLEMGAREPSRDQGRGEARTADGGGELLRLQVRAVINLRGLEGSLVVNTNSSPKAGEGREGASG